MIWSRHGHEEMLKGLDLPENQSAQIDLNQKQLDLSKFGSPVDQSTLSVCFQFNFITSLIIDSCRLGSRKNLIVIHIDCLSCQPEFLLMSVCL